MSQLHTMPLKLEQLFSSLKFRQMRWDEKGAYLLLLCEAWLKAGLIENDETILKGCLTGISDQDFSRIQSKVLEVCFEKVGENWVNSKQKSIYEEVEKKVKKLQISGQKGGLASLAQARLKPGLTFSSKPGSSNQIQNQTQIQNQSTEEKIIKKEIRFSPPKVEEVREYCQEKGYTIDPEAFVNFYESKGWMIGPNKMKVWRAAVATWQKKENEKIQKQGQDSRPWEGGLFG